MGRTTSVVEINGHRYDAVSGEVVGTVIDGFIKRKRRAKPVPQAAKATDRKPAKRAANRTVRQSAKSVHKRTQHSSTLLRTVVVKPSIRIKQTGVQIAKSSSRPAAKIADGARLSRTRIIERHPKVSRFASIQKTAETIESKKILSGEIINAKEKAAHKAAPATKLPAAMPSMVASASHQRLERLLDEALLRADAHKQATKKRSNRWLGLPKWLSISIVMLLVIVVAALIAWRDIPAVAVKAAAFRAKVNASVPAYTPTGYDFSRTISQPGKLGIQYKEKVDPSNTYTLVQQKSNWDSQSLADNSIAQQKQLQTSQVGGTTVYIYGDNSDAAWVNNGTLYTIKNNAHLSSDQLLHIAQGL